MDKIIFCQVFNHDGEAVSEKIHSMVQSSKISIHSDTLYLEEGYTIVRDLPNDKKERYLVLEAQFYSAGVGPQRYVCFVRKETSLLPQHQSGNVYNFHGHNARINQHSTDNSINTVTVNSENLFTELRKVLESLPNNTHILTAVDDMEKNKGKSAYMTSYTKFIALVKDHIDIVAPFIPSLTEYFPG